MLMMGKEASMSLCAGCGGCDWWCRVLKNPECENCGEPRLLSMLKSGVIGEGVWLSMESDEWLRTSCGVGGEPIDEVA